MTYTDQHLDEVVQIAQQLDPGAIERMAAVLAGARNGGPDLLPRRRAAARPTRRTR